MTTLETLYSALDDLIHRGNPKDRMTYSLAAQIMRLILESRARPDEAIAAIDLLAGILPLLTKPEEPIQ
jgi:hypothetical protein